MSLFESPSLIHRTTSRSRSVKTFGHLVWQWLPVRKTGTLGALLRVNCAVPMTFSRVSGRSAGLYMNPNLSGQALVLGMILCANLFHISKRIPFMLITGIGVFVTFSRASILAWLIAVASMLMIDRARFRDFLPSIALCLLISAFIVLPRLDQWLTSWERTGTLNPDVQERLAWLADPFGVSDSSSSSRTAVAREAWDAFAEEPLVGRGTGSTHQVATEPHNQYLVLMVDHGIIGAAILPLLMLAVVWRSQGAMRGTAFVFALAVLVLSLWTHTILRDEHSLVLFSVMAAMAFGSGTRTLLPVMSAVTRGAGIPEELHERHLPV